MRLRRAAPGVSPSAIISAASLGLVLWLPACASSGGSSSAGTGGHVGGSGGPPAGGSGGSGP
ncbi:MAG TPA: hypothetical protein VIU64_18980, partial [Polyangia bacterium]